MLDFHTHILPGIDDGSKDVETSCKMLGMLKEQNVDIVVATPHFYYDTMNFENFKAYREKSLELFLDGLGKLNLTQRPKIALGAEVKFFYGLDVYQNIEALCIRGTRFMLVEMPFEKWEHNMFLALKNLKEERDITPVIAHVERYFPFNSKRQIINNLVDVGALIQCNASYFNSKLTRGKALKMLKGGLIQFIGSDCHNLEERKPDYQTALEVIGSNKYGGLYLNDLEVWQNVFEKSGVILY